MCGLIIRGRLREYYGPCAGVHDTDHLARDIEEHDSMAQKQTIQ